MCAVGYILSIASGKTSEKHFIGITHNQSCGKKVSLGKKHRKAKARQSSETRRPSIQSCLICGSQNLVYDDVTGDITCCDCGLVMPRESSDYASTVGGVLRLPPWFLDARKQADRRAMKGVKNWGKTSNGALELHLDIGRLKKLQSGYCILPIMEGYPQVVVCKEGKQIKIFIQEL